MQRQLRKTNSQNLENASEILVDGYKLMVKRYLSVRTYLGEKGDRRRDEAVRQQCDHVHLPHATCLPFVKRTATDATRRMNPPFAACLPLTPGRRSRWAAACAGPPFALGRRLRQSVALAEPSPSPGRRSSQAHHPYQSCCLHQTAVLAARFYSNIRFLPFFSRQNGKYRKNVIICAARTAVCNISHSEERDIGNEEPKAEGMYSKRPQAEAWGHCFRWWSVRGSNPGPWD